MEARLSEDVPLEATKTRHLDDLLRRVNGTVPNTTQQLGPPAISQRYCPRPYTNLYYGVGQGYTDPAGQG